MREQRAVSVLGRAVGEHTVIEHMSVKLRGQRHCDRHREAVDQYQQAARCSGQRRPSQHRDLAATELAQQLRWPPGWCTPGPRRGEHGSLARKAPIVETCPSAYAI